MTLLMVSSCWHCRSVGRRKTNLRVLGLYCISRAGDKNLGIQRLLHTTSAIHPAYNLPEIQLTTTAWLAGNKVPRLSCGRWPAGQPTQSDYRVTATARSRKGLCRGGDGNKVGLPPITAAKL